MKKEEEASKKEGRKEGSKQLLVAWNFQLKEARNKSLNKEIKK